MLKEPTSMKDCVYFTNRLLDNDGSIMCWVFREKCPKCGKGMMRKPLNPKTGKYKIRAKIYVCSECGHEEDKKEFDEKMTANIKYKCDECGHEGEHQMPFKRKKTKGVEALVFECEECGKKHYITKKMKEIKNKKKKKSK